MNDLRQLCQLITARVPDAQIAVDEPQSSAGLWVVDVDLRGRSAVVEWSPTRGFGISGGGGAYGERPETTAPTVTEALDRVLRFLGAGEPKPKPRKAIKASTKKKGLLRRLRKGFGKVRARPAKRERA